MQKLSHLTFSFLIFSILHSFFEIKLSSALFSSFGAFFPDFDWLLSRMRLVQKFWKFIFKRGLHRTLLHNLWALALFSSLLSFNPPAALFFAIGFLTHLIADSFTKTGIYWFWPFERPHLRWRISTGGWEEKVFQVAIGFLSSLILTLKFLKVL